MYYLSNTDHFRQKCQDRQTRQGHGTERVSIHRHASLAMTAGPDFTYFLRGYIYPRSTHEMLSSCSIPRVSHANITHQINVEPKATQTHDTVSTLVQRRLKIMCFLEEQLLHQSFSTLFLKHYSITVDTSHIAWPGITVDTAVQRNTVAGIWSLRQCKNVLVTFMKRCRDVNLLGKSL